MLLRIRKHVCVILDLTPSYTLYLFDVHNDEPSTFSSEMSNFLIKNHFRSISSDSSLTTISPLPLSFLIFIIFYETVKILGLEDEGDRDNRIGSERSDHSVFTDFV